jgi:hypothetical protein
VNTVGEIFRQVNVPQAPRSTGIPLASFGTLPAPEPAEKAECGMRESQNGVAVAFKVISFMASLCNKGPDNRRPTLG